MPAKADGCPAHEEGRGPFSAGFCGRVQNTAALSGILRTGNISGIMGNEKTMEVSALKEKSIYETLAKKFGANRFYLAGILMTLVVETAISLCRSEWGAVAGDTFFVL